MAGTHLFRISSNKACMTVVPLFSRDVTITGRATASATHSKARSRIASSSPQESVKMETRFSPLSRNSPGEQGGGQNDEIVELRRTCAIGPHRPIERVTKALTEYLLNSRDGIDSKPLPLLVHDVPRALAKSGAGFPRRCLITSQKSRISLTSTGAVDCEKYPRVTLCGKLSEPPDRDRHVKFHPLINEAEIPSRPISGWRRGAGFWNGRINAHRIWK